MGVMGSRGNLGAFTGANVAGTVVFTNSHLRLEARIQWGKTHVSKTVTAYGDGDPKNGYYRGFLHKRAKTLKYDFQRAF